MKVTEDNLKDLSPEKIATIMIDNPFLGEQLENYRLGFITEYELHLEVCEHNIQNKDFEDAYSEFNAAFCSESCIPTIESLAKKINGADDDERELSNKYFLWLDNLFSVLENAGYDLNEIRDEILDYTQIPGRYTSIWGVRMNQHPSKTYIIRCHVATNDAIKEVNFKYYSTDHVAPDKWADILKSSVHNGDNICVLEGEQFIPTKESAALFLDYIESPNAYLPLSIISEIKKHFRCIDYSDYIRSYGQARTIVDLFKEYATAHPIKDILDWDKAVCLIGSGIGDQSAIDDFVCNHVATHPEFFRIKDSGFDVERFARIVLNEQNLASNTYEGIVRTRSISKLWYIIRILLRTKNYKSDIDFYKELKTVLKKAKSPDPNKKSILADSFPFFESIIFTIEEGLKDDKYNIEIWEEFLFNRFEDSIAKLGFKKVMSRYFAPYCHMGDSFGLQIPLINGFPTVRMVDGEMNFCMPDIYNYDWADGFQESYEWILINDIVKSSPEYVSTTLLEDDIYNEDGREDEIPEISEDFWHNYFFYPNQDNAFYFPKEESDNNLPIFYSNQGRITEISPDEKIGFLAILRNRYKIQNQE